MLNIATYALLAMTFLVISFAIWLAYSQGVERAASCSNACTEEGYNTSHLTGNLKECWCLQSTTWKAKENK